MHLYRLEVTGVDRVFVFFGGEIPRTPFSSLLSVGYNNSKKPPLYVLFLIYKTYIKKLIFGAVEKWIN